MTAKELYTKVYPIQDIILRKRLVNLTKEKKLKKNEFLFKQDEIDKSIFFLKAGVVTSSEIHQNGKVNCLGVFYEPGEILVGGLGPGSPYSPINAVARTSCEVYELSIKWFLEHYPGVIDKISHELIASFLHMSPVTLSRVRKTIS